MICWSLMAKWNAPREGAGGGGGGGSGGGEMRGMRLTRVHKHYPLTACECKMRDAALINQFQSHMRHQAAVQLDTSKMSDKHSSTWHIIADCSGAQHTYPFRSALDNKCTFAPLQFESAKAALDSSYLRLNTLRFSLGRRHLTH